MVNIRVKRKASSRRGTAPYDVEGSASGVIITPDGYIVNNRIAYRMGNRDPYMAPHSVYRCRGDDCWVAIAISSEDNEYVYKEVLGYTDDEIADLLIEGVITTEADLPGVSTF